MNRNMMRRIEIAWPILDKAMQLRVIKENLQPYLDDTQDAWVLGVDGHYSQVKHAHTDVIINDDNYAVETKVPQFKSAQTQLMKLYKSKT